MALAHLDRNAAAVNGGAAGRPGDSLGHGGGAGGIGSGASAFAKKPQSQQPRTRRAPRTSPRTLTGERAQRVVTNPRARSHPKPAKLSGAVGFAKGGVGGASFQPYEDVGCGDIQPGRPAPDTAAGLEAAATPVQCGPGHDSGGGGSSYSSGEGTPFFTPSHATESIARRIRPNGTGGAGQEVLEASPYQVQQTPLPSPPSTFALLPLLPPTPRQ